MHQDSAEILHFASIPWQPHKANYVHSFTGALIHKKRCTDSTNLMSSMIRVRTRFKRGHVIIHAWVCSGLGYTPFTVLILTVWTFTQCEHSQIIRRTFTIRMYSPCLRQGEYIRMVNVRLMICECSHCVNVSMRTFTVLTFTVQCTHSQYRHSTVNFLPKAEFH